jgi:hypothetical protein
MLIHFLLHKSYYLIVIALIQQWLNKVLQCDNLPAIINLIVITYIKGIVQPFELGGETRLIRSAVK